MIHALNLTIALMVLSAFAGFCIWANGTMKRDDHNIGSVPWAMGVVRQQLAYKIWGVVVVLSYIVCFLYPSA